MSLIIENLSKAYGNGVHALRDVSLSLGPGMFGLLGPNGAGKSSLMRTLATLQDPDSGRVTFEGWDALANKERFRSVLGYLPQEFGVYPYISAAALLDYFARLKGVSDAAIRRKHVASILDMVNLTQAAHRNVDTYSGGMRQRFGIAQALLGEPRLIIVDEPTAGLDPAERNRFHAILSEIGASITVLLSTHIVEDVANLCQRMAILSQGSILACGAPRELMAQLDGRLWWRRLERGAELPSVAGTRVLSARLQEGTTRLVVVADSMPGAGFTSKEPDLEDVYFSHIPQAAA